MLNVCGKYSLKYCSNSSKVLKYCSLYSGASLLYTSEYFFSFIFFTISPKYIFILAYSLLPFNLSTSFSFFSIPVTYGTLGCSFFSKSFVTIIIIEANVSTKSTNIIHKTILILFSSLVIDVLFFLASNFYLLPPSFILTLLICI